MCMSEYKQLIVVWSISAIVFTIFCFKVDESNRGVRLVELTLNYTSSTISGRNVYVSYIGVFPVVQLLVSNTWIELVTAILILILASTNRYLRTIGKGSNPIRWISYAITASIQSACVGVYCGIVDVPGILGLMFSTASVMFFGYLMEKCKSRPSRMRVFSCGCIVFMGRFAILLSAFSTKESPTFVKLLFIFNELLYASFGVVGYVYCTMNNRSDENFFKINTAYNRLSIVAKNVINGIAIGQALSTI